MMDAFEKQQRIDAFRGIVKVRWYYIFLIGAWGLFEKMPFFHWGVEFNYGLIMILFMTTLGINFVYWFFIRRPVNAISEQSLITVSALQVVVDQLTYTIIVYFSGTTETITALLYFVSILTASSLFKKRGLVLSGLLSIFLYSGLVLGEYYKFIPHIKAFPGTVWSEVPYISLNFLSAFVIFMVAATFFAAFLSDLIRRREQNLRAEKDRVVEQAQILRKQKEELTETKNWLNDALVKSDKARLELYQTREELAKTNEALKARIKELERFNEITIGREIKMSELKNRIKELESKIREKQS